MRFNMRDLFSNLDSEEYQDIEIHSDSDISPNLDNIKRGVLDRIDERSSLEGTRRKRKLRRSFKGVWAAVLVICVTATTVFALNNNLDFFKGIFGDGIQKMEKDIQDVIATTENKDFIFTVESLLTDGNQNYFIVSLERKDGEEIGDIKPNLDAGIIREKSEGVGGVGVLGVEKIEGEDVHRNKGYYLFEYSTTNNIIGEKIEIVLDGTYEKSRAPEDIYKFDKELSVSFDIEDNGSIKTLDMKEPQLLKEKYYITEVKYSNLGMNIVGEYIEDTKIIPGVRVRLKYKDGSIKEVIRPHQGYSEEFGFAYSRRGEKFQNMIIFKKPIYFDEIQSIMLEEKEYKIE